MFLFFISFLLVFLSSYFLTSIISPKKSIIGTIYLFLIAFAQIVLTFEVLSLFSAISEGWVLIVNTCILVISVYLWNRKKRPLWSLEFADLRRRINNSLKFDKALMWLYVAFGVLILSALTLSILLPVTNADAHAYHVARCVFWIIQKNLNHFDVADIRAICLPINSEILYTWVMLFLKRDCFLGLFSFIGYLLSIISIYNVLGFLGYCVRKRLWVIFILSSFASVVVQLSSTETDIIIAGLITSSIYLFWYALKNDKKMPVFMSALAYALAIGTKTTAIIAIPGTALLMIALCYYYRKIKPLFAFIGFGLINFLIFSFYNYLLNFIQFSDFFGAKSFIVVSKNYFGIKGAASNFIKYIFMFVDFTGFKWSYYSNPYISHIREIILNFLNLPIEDGFYSMPYFVNGLLLEPAMGAGVLGFLVFLPCVIWSLVKPVFCKKSKKTLFTLLFASVFVVNIIVISYLLAYMSYTVRFVMTFMLISSPVLVYSYSKKINPLKFIIVLFGCFYMMFVSTFLWPRPFVAIWPILLKHPSITYLRDIAHCKTYTEDPAYTNPTCLLATQVKGRYSKDNKILAFMNTSDSIFLFELLKFQGYKIDFRTMEDINNIDLNKYDLIISSKKGQASTLIKDYEKRKDECKIINHKFVLKQKILVPCLYVENPRLKSVNNPEAHYPFEVRCGMSKEFINDNKLELDAIAGFNNYWNKDFSFYYTYRNKNLPDKYKDYK